jgi:hypothetical protein
MFHPSSERISFRQQVIALNQSYPCPRCTVGMMEPFGLTETFQCNACKRGFVPLKGGRFLYPARLLGWRIAPTFWWDGFKWHWAGTTATARQLATIVLVSLLPVLLVNLAIYLQWWTARPDWCNSVLLSPLVGLLTVQLVYLACWDFDFLSRKQSDTVSSSAVKDA